MMTSCKLVTLLFLTVCAFVSHGEPVDMEPICSGAEDTCYALLAKRHVVASMTVDLAEEKEDVQEMVADTRYNAKACPDTTARVFDLRHSSASADGCKARCLADASCIVFSGVFNSWCIGCSSEMTLVNSATPNALAFRKQQAASTSQEMVADTSYNAKACPDTTARVFDLRHSSASADGCKAQCLAQASCIVFSGVFNSWCIGCSSEMTLVNSATPNALAFRKQQVLPEPTAEPTAMPTAEPPSVLNGGFEEGSVTSSYQYQNAAGGVPRWNTTGGTGWHQVFIRSGNGAWQGTTTTEGDYFLGLQLKDTAIAQPLRGHQVGRAYTLHFSAASRRGSSTALLIVKVQGEVLKSFAPANKSFTQYSVPYTAASDTVDIKFENGSPTGDYTVFVDDIYVA